LFFYYRRRLRIIERDNPNIYNLGMAINLSSNIKQNII